MSLLRRCLLVCGLLSSCLAPLAQAQNSSSQTIRLLVPYVPGGLPDTVARIVAQRLGDALGQPVVVDNKPGAGGAVAAGVLAQAPADGTTFMVTDGPMLAIQPFVNAKPAFQADKDFMAVSLIGTAPLYLAVNSKVKATNLEELVALAKARPDALNYGSAGLGSIHHLTAEAMKAGLDIQITHVPFRGSGQSVPAMIGGQVDMIFASPPALMGFVQNGQARLIAINAAKRSALTPQVPALAEKIPGFDFAFSVVMLAKPGTPPTLIQRMNEEIAKIVRMPAVIEQFAKAGVDPLGADVQDSEKALHAEGLRIADAARRARLTTQ